MSTFESNVASDGIKYTCLQDFDARLIVSSARTTFAADTLVKRSWLLRTLSHEAKRGELDKSASAASGLRLGLLILLMLLAGTAHEDGRKRERIDIVDRAATLL